MSVMKRNVFILFYFCFALFQSELYGSEGRELDSYRKEFVMVEEFLKLKSEELGKIQKRLAALEGEIAKEKNTYKKDELLKEQSVLSQEKETALLDLKKLTDQKVSLSKEMAEIMEKGKGENKTEEERLAIEKKTRYEAKLNQQKEQELKIKKEKEEERKKIQGELAAVKETIKQKNLALKKSNLKIKELSQGIVLAVSQDETEEFLSEKNKEILNKTLLEKEIDDLNKSRRKLTEKLKVKDDGYELAEGTLNWNKIYDIEVLQRKRPGTWNLSVIAKDSMNNYSEPNEINIKIDPKSDIPYLNIINPKPNGRIPGNLMVVGVAGDDDKVEKVVMFLNDEKKERICTGTDFWYYDLDTSGLEDGKHKLSFKVTDVNGVQSKLYSVPFILDRKVPLISISTINSGAVVSGRKKIGGVVEDTNGIRSMEYSIDERYSFTKILDVRGIAANRKKCAWNFLLDTNQLGSGTQVVWIKATDYAGSEGFFPLTLIVDKEPPTVGFHYPNENDTIGDRFTLYGYVKDNVEVKDIKLRIKCSGFPDKEYPVSFTAGNPMWSFPIDIAQMGDVTKLKNGKMVIEVTVQDVAGNVVKKKLSLNINTELEKPKVELKSVAKREGFANEVPIYGPIQDDEGVKDVTISLYNEKNEIVYSKIVDAQYSMSSYMDVSNYEEGLYTVEVTPQDYYVKGDPQRQEIYVDRSHAKFDVDKMIKTFCSEGIHGKLELDFSVIKYGELKSAEYCIVDPQNSALLQKGEVKMRAGEKTGIYHCVPMTINLSDKNQVEGLKLLQLTITDMGMKRSSVTIPLLIDNTPPVFTDFKYDEKIGMMKSEEIVISDNQLMNRVEIVRSSSAGGDPEKAILVPGEEKKFSMSVKNAEGKWINYDYEVKAFDQSGLMAEKKYRVRFKETKEKSLDLTFKLPKREHFLYLNRSKVFWEDNTKASASVVNPDAVSCLFGFTTENPLDVVVQLGNGNEKKVVPVNPECGLFLFEITEELRKEFVIGNNDLVFSNKDKDGKQTVFETVTFYNDTAIPKTKVIWPPSYVPFNSNLFIYGIADDDSGIVSVSAGLDTEDESKFQSLSLEPISALRASQVPMLDPMMRKRTQSIGDYLADHPTEIYLKGNMYRFELPVDSLPEGEHLVRFKVTDKAGKVAYTKALVLVDKKAPMGTLLAPKENDRLNGTITLRGMASDECGIGKVVARMNDGIVLGNGTEVWDIFYDLYEREEYDPDDKERKSLSLDIPIVIYDNAGNQTELVTKVILDQEKDIPSVLINSPAIDGQRYTTDMIKFEGVAFDDDGIDSVQYRVDYGLDELGDVKLGGKSEDLGWKNILLKESEKPNWSVTMVPGYLKPGEHILEVRAFDTSYIESEIKSIVFHIDKENPLIEVISPQNGEYVKGVKLISGKAHDPNGIELVEISTNNGWSFVPAEGKENWMYYLDSSTLPDGALKFLIKVKDKVGSEAYSFSIFNIDNTPPELSVLLPRDGMSINNKYTIVGRAKDNIALKSGFIKITQGSRNMLSNTDEEGFAPVNGLEAWSYDLDVSQWEFGTYHLVVKMTDMAGNCTEKSLDFTVDPRSDFPLVELDQPQSGQHLSGDMIEFYGTAFDDDGIEAVYLQIDGGERIRAEGTTQWRHLEPSVNLKPGLHRVIVVAQEKSTVPEVPGKFSLSISRNFYVDDSGVIIHIASHTNGDSVGHRPWIEGSAQFYEKDLDLKMKKRIQTKKYYELKKKWKDAPEKIPQVDTIPVSKFEVETEMNRYLLENQVKAIYMSYDNGNSFKSQFGVPEAWKSRLQTQYLKNGPHMLQFKAVTKAGKETIKYFKVNIDREVPTVVIDAPDENARVNGVVQVKGYTDDNNKVEEVKIRLKQFDKNLGKMPKFIDGIYLWVQAFGGPIVSGGFGFSFFENIVRLEGAFGWVPTQENVKDFGINLEDPNLFTKALGWPNNRYEPRFPGFVGGGKLLARVVDIPFEFFWGEDAANFSVSIEVGAGFYWFSGFGGAAAEVNGSYYRNKRMMEGVSGSSSSIAGYDPSKDARVLAGFMYQIDFFKVHRYKFLKDFALYFENSFYFIASEVESTLTPQFAFGVRNSIL